MEVEVEGMERDPMIEDSQLEAPSDSPSTPLVRNNHKRKAKAVLPMEVEVEESAIAVEVPLEKPVPVPVEVKTESTSPSPKSKAVSPFDTFLTSVQNLKLFHDIWHYI